MNATISKLYVLVLAFAAMALVNCSKGSSGGGDSSTPAPAASTTCAAGQLYTIGAGCLPQCGTAMVVYNNQCVSQYSISGGQAQSCGTGMLQSQYGCLPQCGTNAVIYNNQCVPVTTTGGIGGGGYPGGANMCQGSCGAGQVQVAGGCLPQGACGACYGQNNGWCYIGTYAHQYYGY
jgi:hypothetical protein